VVTAAPKSKNAKVTLVYQHELPNCPGKSIKGVLVEYGPGGSSPAHTHAKSAFIYATVLQGAIRSQVNEGPATTYTAGQIFSELPVTKRPRPRRLAATSPPQGRQRLSSAPIFLARQLCSAKIPACALRRQGCDRTFSFRPLFRRSQTVGDTAAIPILGGLHHLYVRVQSFRQGH